jgi:hypothetical protein
MAMRGGGGWSVVESGEVKLCGPEAMEEITAPCLD